MTATWISQFHNLKGITIAEKKKSLNIFKKSIPIESVDLFLNELKTNSYFEDLLRADILIYFHKYLELLELLKNGNDVIISKIVKQSWFFQKAFTGVNEEEFVNKILPQFSYGTRGKILKKVSRIFNELQIDNVFDHLHKRYGLHNALEILPKCSKDKIAIIITDNECVFSFSQLKQLYAKNKECIVSYIIEKKKQGNYVNKFLIYLSQHDPPMFWKICEECQWVIKLGRRTTKRELLTMRKNLVENPAKFLPYFRKDRVVREIYQSNYDEFAHIYKSLFPQKMRDIRSIYTTDIIKFIPKHKQFPLFSCTYLNMLGEEIQDNKKIINQKLLELIKDEELRELLADKKYKETSDPLFLSYYRKTNAISLIKEKINLTSKVHERDLLLSFLVKVCSLNNDLTTLENILEYFHKRHKGDQASLKSSFLGKISDCFNDSDLENFNENHWQYINQIIHSIGECSTYHVAFEKLVLKYLEILYKSGNNVKDKWETYLVWRYSDVTLTDLFDKITSILKNPEFEKHLFMLTIEYLPNNKGIEDLVLSSLVSGILDHNKKNSGFKIVISENETMKKILCDILTRKEESAYRDILSCEDFIRCTICKSNRNSFEEQVLNHYYSNLQNCFGTSKIFEWFLRHDPCVLSTYVESILSNTREYNNLPWHSIKMYSHLSLDQKVVTYCVENLTKDYNKKYCKPLSIVMAPGEYIKLVQPYIPETFVMETEDRKQMEAFKMQCDLAVNVRNVYEKKDGLNLIMQFAYGDYLQYILPALHKLSHNVPEDCVESLVDELFDRKKDSAKKLCICLSNSLLSEHKKKIFYNKLMNFKSMQKPLFRILLRQCKVNPSEVNFKNLLVCMKNLEKEDIESLKLLQNSYVKIPKIYHTLFFIEGWQLFEKLRGDSAMEGTDFDNMQLVFLQNYLQKYKDLLNELPLEFSKALIDKYFLKVGESKIGKSSRDIYFRNFGDFNIRPLLSFVYQFMIVNEQNFNYIFEVISLLKNNMENDEFLRNVLIFFNNLAGNISNLDKENTCIFLRRYKMLWESIFTPVEAIKQFIILDLRLSYVESENPILQNFAHKIVTALKTFISKYGELSYNIYFSILQIEIRNFIVNEDLLDLFFHLLDIESSTLIYTLVIDLLNSVKDLSEEPKMHEIKQKLKLCTSSIVMLRYNFFENN